MNPLKQEASREHCHAGKDGDCNWNEIIIEAALQQKEAELATTKQEREDIRLELLEIGCDQHISKSHPGGTVSKMWVNHRAEVAEGELGRLRGAGWISVNERMPDKRDGKFPQLVLMAVEGQTVYPEVGWFHEDDGKWQSVETAPMDEPIYFERERVTHWMKLPELPAALTPDSTPPQKEK